MFYPTISPYLINILQACIAQQYFPQIWKKSLVAVIPKVGRSDYKLPSSFRPISLLSTLGKVLEKIIQRRLVFLSDSHKWLSDRQHGFRHGHSTITALHEVVSRIEEGFSHGAYTSCLLLDIKGAFDNITHQGIIDCLVKKGCTSYLVNILKGFLFNRTALLQLNDNSLLCHLHKGCPQGSSLSPFLWNVVCDDILASVLPKGVHIQGFADDISLIKTGITMESMQYPL